MFGLVRPYYRKMLKHEKREYKCYYCGLCMGMGRNTGLLSRFLVNYDVCLAYLVADSIFLDKDIKKARCPFSIYKRVNYRDNIELLNKMSNINYILSYHKVLDDIYDDKSIKARIVEKLMRRKYNVLKETYAQTVKSVTDGMKKIRETESSYEYVSVYDSALPFGLLLENAMAGCLQNSIDDQIFSMLCKHLGMWIYVIDACVDLKKDLKHDKYNPLRSGNDGDNIDDIIATRKEEIVSFLMSCKLSMQQLIELLSCGKNENIINNLFEYALPQEVADLLK